MVETNGRTAVELSGDHIRCGNRWSSTGCPVGLAVKDVYPAAERIVVDWFGVTILIGGERFIHRSTAAEALRDLVNRMRWGMEIKPQTLNLWFQRG